jgi:SRSO17 transposase
MRCCPDNEVVSCADLRDWSAEFEELTGRISGLFVHPKSRLHARRYLEGLLAPIERKNGWTIAEYVGEREPKALQRFLNLASWDADALRAIGRDYAMEHLADARGVAHRRSDRVCQEGAEIGRRAAAVLGHAGPD